MTTTTLISKTTTEICTGMTVIANTGNAEYIDRVVSVNGDCVVLQSGVYVMQSACVAISCHTVNEGDFALITDGVNQYAITVQSSADGDGWFSAYVWSVGVMQVHLSQIFVK